jgi:hypothetical protein
MDYKQYISDIKMNLESGNKQWRSGDRLLAAGPMGSPRVRHRLLAFTLLLAPSPPKALWNEARMTVETLPSC